MNIHVLFPERDARSSVHTALTLLKASVAASPWRTIYRDLSVTIRYHPGWNTVEILTSEARSKVTFKDGSRTDYAFEIYDTSGERSLRSIGLSKASVARIESEHRDFSTMVVKKRLCDG